MLPAAGAPRLLRTHCCVLALFSASAMVTTLGRVREHYTVSTRAGQGQQQQVTQQQLSV
jgi:hypothetical protein